MPNNATNVNEILWLEIQIASIFQMMIAVQLMPNVSFNNVMSYHGYWLITKDVRRFTLL